MFEKRLKEISKKIGEESKKEFYILTHKKHRREIYFQNNKKAINFMKNKFDSPFKRIIYFLIKINALQPFLKKIKLSSELGDVIYIANQIKAFDLDKREVTSFIKDDSIKKLFIKWEKSQDKIAKKRFAPEIYQINKSFPYSKEELLKEYLGGKDIEVFKKLYSFYKLNFLEEGLVHNKIEDPFAKNILQKILSTYPADIKLKMARIHGSFAKEQILSKNNSYIFTDWMGNEKNLIIRDLVNYFRNESNFLKNKHFIKILQIYPANIRENIKLYLILNEIYSMIKDKKVLKIHKERIKNLSL